MIVPTRDGYDRWATIYDSERNPLIALEERHFPQMLPDVGRRLVADVGCGTGRQTLKLVKRGAGVVAIDFSQNMLRRAQEQVRSEQVFWLFADVLTSIPLRNGVLDGAVCSLVLEHVPDLAPTLREFRRVCKSDGFVLISDIHPAAASGGAEAGFTDPETGQKVFPRGYRHELSGYVEAAKDAGFGVDTMIEAAVDHELANSIPRAAKYLGSPMLVVLSLTARRR